MIRKFKLLTVRVLGLAMVSSVFYGCASTNTNSPSANTKPVVHKAAHRKTTPVHKRHASHKQQRAPHQKSRAYYQRRWEAQQAAALAAKKAQYRRAYEIAQKKKAAELERRRYENMNVWTHIHKGFRLGNHHTQKPVVQREIQRYARHPQHITATAQRADKYLHLIVQELKRRGMPTELALLPFVESRFKSTAYSHKGAAGLWQFIPSTGRTFGLEQNAAYDARLDPMASTQAALNFLQQLHRQNRGDWLLALAAYNCGQGCVNKAVAKQQRKGRSTSYWHLDLPKETRQYVPRLLAYKAIISNPGRYGMRLPYTPNRSYLTQTHTTKAINLHQFARQSGMGSQLMELNAAYRKGITPHGRRNRIILPREHASRLTQLIQRLQPMHGGRYAAASSNKGS